MSHLQGNSVSNEYFSHMCFLLFFTYELEKQQDEALVHDCNSGLRRY